MFQNRQEAGKLLAERLESYRNNDEVAVLAIPRGGVVVGRQIADKLHISLYLVVVKKLGAPNNPELAIGAVAPYGTKMIDWDLALRLGVEQDYLDEEIKRKQKEVEERQKKFSIFNFQFSNIKKKNIFIIIDDGVATGATISSAIKYIKQISSVYSSSERQRVEKLYENSSRQARTIILAVPVIAKDAYNRLQSEVDKIIALEVPDAFGAVGEFYREFPQVTDEEVIKYLK
ncbi:phosphoribosyltransferase [Candidatus Gottesmanbacteria bacterium]|nr:phosphoribosyltransferase [Candidatus Gottesmanbacteria bacterium]